jgi:hypothetical protein
MALIDPGQIIPEKYCEVCGSTVRVTGFEKAPIGTGGDVPVATTRIRPAACTNDGYGVTYDYDTSANRLARADR